MIFLKKEKIVWKFQMVINLIKEMGNIQRLQIKLSKEIFEFENEKKKFETEIKILLGESESQEFIDDTQVEETLHSVMDKLIQLEKSRNNLLQNLENNSISYENEFVVHPSQNSKETKNMIKNNRIIEIVSKKENINHEMKCLRENKQTIQNEIQKLTSDEKKLKEEMTLLLKQKEDLLIFKLKAINGKKKCNSDQNLVNKYISLGSKELIDEIKIISKKKFGYTEKDKIIYNQLNNIETKQIDYKSKVTTIGDNCQQANEFLESCEKKIENLTEEQFNKFKNYFIETFNIFEPNYILNADLIQNSQKK